MLTRKYARDCEDETWFHKRLCLVRHRMLRIFSCGSCWCWSTNPGRYSLCKSPIDFNKNEKIIAVTGCWIGYCAFFIVYSVLISNLKKQPSEFLLYTMTALTEAETCEHQLSSIRLPQKVSRNPSTRVFAIRFCRRDWFLLQFIAKMCRAMKWATKKRFIRIFLLGEAECNCFAQWDL